MESELEVIDAFVDGERVDPVALKAALASPAGRDYFVDAWMLREAVSQDATPVPEKHVVKPASPPVRSTSVRWLVPAALAAGIAGGYVAGDRSTTVAPSPSPVPAVTAAGSAPAPIPSVFPVPPATKVIQLQFQPTSPDNTKSGGD